MSVLLRKRFLQRRISALRQAFHRWWPCGHCDASGGPMRAVMLLCALLVDCGPVASGTGSTGGASIDAGPDTDGGIDGGHPIQQFTLRIGVKNKRHIHSIQTIK